MAKITLNIGGMHCGSCAASVQMFLANKEGVKSSTVDYDAKRSEVEYDESKLKAEDLIKAVEEVGYTATKVS